MILDFSYPRNLGELRLLARAVLANLEGPRSVWEGPLPVLLVFLLLGLATFLLFAAGPRTHNERLAGAGILVVDATGSTNMDPADLASGPYTVMVHEGGEVIERKPAGSPGICAREAHRLAVYHNAEALCLPAIPKTRSLGFAPRDDDQVDPGPPGPFLSIEVPRGDPS